jgi:hypothetical protein
MPQRDPRFPGSRTSDLPNEYRPRTGIRNPALLTSTATSGAIHGVLGLLAGLLVITSTASRAMPDLESAWQTAERVDDQLPERLIDTTTPQEFPSEFRAADALPANSPLAEPDFPFEHDSTTFAGPNFAVIAASDFAVGVPEHASVAGVSGTGTGEGSGGGFFGSTESETSVVFVVDNSRSMNRPHDSPAKTRFRRVKVELVNCVAAMPQSRRFSIIFFARETVPLSQTELLPATDTVKASSLEWVARMGSGGAPTDPRSALRGALRMRPDQIYFLTDGEFDRPIVRDLMMLKQSATRIDTFAFGDQAGETVLKTLAENNRGTYRFIP